MLLAAQRYLLVVLGLKHKIASVLVHIVYVLYLLKLWYIFEKHVHGSIGVSIYQQTDIKFDSHADIDKVSVPKKLPPSGITY